MLMLILMLTLYTDNHKFSRIAWIVNVNVNVNVKINRKWEMNECVE